MRVHFETNDRFCQKWHPLTYTLQRRSVSVRAVICLVGAGVFLTSANLRRSGRLVAFVGADLVSARACRLRTLRPNMSALLTVSLCGRTQGSPLQDGLWTKLALMGVFLPLQHASCTMHRLINVYESSAVLTYRFSSAKKAGKG